MGPPLRILVAEDEPVSQQVAGAMLRRLGAEITLASNGLDAVGLAASRRFDLILMDYHMPGMDGMAAARLIRRREAESATGRVPIIALTADALEEDMPAFIAAGMDEVLLKPVRQAMLAGLLSRYRLPPGHHPR